MSKIYCVPENCLFNSVDDSMHVFPEDAVTFMVSSHDYNLMKTREAKLVAAIKLMQECCNRISHKWGIAYEVLEELGLNDKSEDAK